jgi:uncharacterized protein YfaS (alpha-2-macroglobulin family)
VTVTDTDNSGCGATTFGLGTSAPSGWTATLSSSTLTLSPGTSATTTLNVTAPSTAADGLYTIPVSATNSAAPTYTAAASATETLVSSLTVAATTNSSSYSKPAQITVTANVSAGQIPVSGTSVSFTVTTPTGGTLTGTATTDATGTAAWKYRLKAKDPVGQWQVQAGASLLGITGSGTTTFVVQ